MRPLIVVLALALPVALAGRVFATQMPAAPSRAVTTTAAGAAVARGAPSAGSQTTVAPSLRVRVEELRRIPIVLDPAATDPQSVDRFIMRAGASVPAEREQVRAALQKAKGDPKFAAALADRAFELRARDYSATLTALSLLGELRAPEGERRLLEFAVLPLPTEGHKVEGEIVERTTLEHLQMKAVQGLAYARTPSGDASVLKLAAGSPSRNVRAEAAEAYLFNHGYSADARKALGAVLQPADQIYLDRPHLLPGMPAAAFNAQLATYLRLHPNLVPPAPQHTKVDYAIVERDRAKDAPLLKRPVMSRETMILKGTAPPDRLQ